MVKIPVIAAGILSEPPMSVPMPKGLPHDAIRADSPPDEPPEVSSRLRGLTVLFKDQQCTEKQNQNLTTIPSVTIVDRLSDHHSSWNVGLDVCDSSELTEHLDNGAVFLHRLFCPRTEAGGARLANDVEIVLE